jgi:uncharacterized protein YllA (UPF0747 family)
MSENDLLPVYGIYTDYLEKGVNQDIAIRLWGIIPETMYSAYKQIREIKEKYSITAQLDDFKKGLKHYHRQMGILTGKVKDSIDALSNGVVEAGQQPNCLGGPSLSLNKIAYAKRLCGLGEDGFVPVFYHADYDGVQAELVNIRIPSLSSRGLLISYPIDVEYENSPIYAVPNPNEDWLKGTIEKIEGNYRGMLIGVDNRTRETIQHRMEHIITVIKTAYFSTGNLSDFAARILGTLVNVEADTGVPFVAPSRPEVRSYFQPGYEMLLAEPARSKFVEASNKIVEYIEDVGYKPQVGFRGKDYVPFFLECMTQKCHRGRMELKYIRSFGNSQSIIKGKCPKCEEQYEYSFNVESPDLSDLIDWISPRVDSRQIVVDSVYPVLAHIGGPGETSYYAEVIPAVKPLEIPFPVFLRYTRTFYNTPWGEKMAKSLKEEGYKTMINENLFNALGRWVEARNNDNAHGLAEAHRDIHISIRSSYKELLNDLELLEKDIQGIKKQLSRIRERRPLIEEMRKKQEKANKIEHYLSVAYGRFSPEKFAQEVNWSWIDLALVSGVVDLMGVYDRIYNKYTPNSSMYFVNT